MHPSLLLLLKLRIRAAIRKMLNAMKSPRGMLFTILGGLIFASWLGPAVISATFRRSNSFEPEASLLYGPAILLLLCVANIVSRMSRGAIYFTPAEIDFLFPSPIARIHLVIYKLLGVIAASIGIGVFLSIFLAGVSPRLMTGVVGMTLAVLFVNLVSIAVAMIRENIAQAPKLMRYVSLVVAISILLLFVWPLTSISLDEGFRQTVREVLESPTVHAALSPLRVLILSIVAENLSDFAVWALVSLAMNALVFGLIVRLDALNLESALQTSRRQHDRIHRANRGLTHVTWRGAHRWRLPLVGRFGGVGTIVWRQMTTALRTSHSIFILLCLIVAVVAGVTYLVDEEHQIAALVGMSWIGVFMTFFLITMTRFDFRSDLDQIESLKMLPIRPALLVIGQLLTPIVLLTLVQWAALAILATAFGYAWVMLIIATFVMPLNIVLVGIENTLFLVYPTRQIAVGLGDLQAVGRNMVLFLLRFVAIVIWAGIAGVFGLIAMFIASGSTAALLITLWIVLTVTALAVVPITAAAFRRFDVSIHMPA